MVNIPDLIRIGRAKKGLNQLEFAQKIGVVASAVSQWESGSKVPSGEVMIKIIQELDLVSELFPDYVKKDALAISNEEVLASFQEKMKKDLLDYKLGLMTAMKDGLIEGFSAKYPTIAEDFTKALEKSFGKVKI